MKLCWLQKTPGFFLIILATIGLSKRNSFDGRKELLRCMLFRYLIKKDKTNKIETYIYIHDKYIRKSLNTWNGDSVGTPMWRITRRQRPMYLFPQHTEYILGCGKGPFPQTGCAVTNNYNFGTVSTIIKETRFIYRQNFRSHSHEQYCKSCVTMETTKFYISCTTYQYHLTCAWSTVRFKWTILHRFKIIPISTH
jgi:hypothetical protein